MLDFKGLLFDLDGTLLDTAPDFISALNLQLARHNRPPLPDSAIRTSVTNGSVGLIQAAFNIDPQQSNFETLREEFLELYFDNLADRTVLFEGLQQVLDECRCRQIPWGVVTNKPWRYTQSVMTQLDLLEAAATVICPDHVQQTKPHPEPILLACEEISLAPQDCIYVGDHIRDIQAGRSAGARNIAAAWGYIEEHENIDNWQADWVVKKSAQLHSLLFKK